MKNMISPEKLAILMQKPVSFERVAEFLSTDVEITATQLCKMLNVDSQGFFNWKSKKLKRNTANAASSKADLLVEPTGQGKKKYSPEEKLKLLKTYAPLEDATRAEFLRKFGLYQSDIDRWEALTNEASLGALSKRKTRSDKKSDEQIELEDLKKELRGQEKTIAKLAALVVIQKKVSAILGAEQD